MLPERYSDPTLTAKQTIFALACLLHTSILAVVSRRGWCCADWCWCITSSLSTIYVGRRIKQSNNSRTINRSYDFGIRSACVWLGALCIILSNVQSVWIDWNNANFRVKILRLRFHIFDINHNAEISCIWNVSLVVNTREGFKL